MIWIERHVQDPDGTVRLALRVSAPPAGDHATTFGATGAECRDDGECVVLSWSWPPGMVPPDEVATCARIVRRALAAWAARWWAGPSGPPAGVALSEPGGLA